MKVPRLCLPVFLAEVRLREGKASEVDFVMRREFAAYNWDFDFNAGRATLRV